MSEVPFKFDEQGNLVIRDEMIEKLRITKDDILQKAIVEHSLFKDLASRIDMIEAKVNEESAMRSKNDRALCDAIGSLRNDLARVEAMIQSHGS